MSCSAPPGAYGFQYVFAQLRMRHRSWETPFDESLHDAGAVRYAMSLSCEVPAFPRGRNVDAA